MNSTRICITGGHATPALAVVAAIRSLHPEWELMWIGRKKALEGSSVVSEEPRLVQEAQIPFYSIDAGRITRAFSFWTFVGLCKIPVGCIQSFFLLRQQAPTLVCSFGGYVAVPVAVSAWLLGIPVVTHEQTHRPGLANRIIGLFAKKIFVSYSTSLTRVPKEKGVYTGLPVRDVIFVPPKNPTFPVSYDKKPLLSIMGGSTGSTSINTVIYQALPQLLLSYRVIHQVGAFSYEEAKKVREQLGSHKDRYTVLPYLDGEDLAWVYRHSDLVISRSGANTVAELLALGKKAICIPLPWAGDHEQERNAEELVQRKQGMILPQKELIPETLIHAIDTMLTKGEEKEKKPITSEGQQASAMIVQVLEQCV